MPEKPRTVESPRKKPVDPTLDLREVIPPPVVAPPENFDLHLNDENLGRKEEPFDLADIDKVKNKVNEEPFDLSDIDKVLERPAPDLNAIDLDLERIPTEPIQTFPDLPRPVEPAPATEPEIDSLIEGLRIQGTDAAPEQPRSVNVRPSAPREGDELTIHPASPEDEMEDQSMPIKFEPKPPRQVKPRFVFPEDPSATKRDLSDPIQALDDQIQKEKDLISRDDNQGLGITAQGDKEKLKDLIAQRDALIAEKEKPAPVSPMEATTEPIDLPPAAEAPKSAAPEPVAPKPTPELKIPDLPKVRPEPVPAPEPAPQTPEQPEPAEPIVEAKSFEEVLKLQEEAFSARRDMMRARHGKKVESLSKKDQAEYKRLKQIAQEKRKTWLAELGKLPEDQQEESKDLTKLKEVQDRLASMTPEQVTEEALDATLDTYQDQLAQLDTLIKGMEDLRDYDKNTVRVVTALGNADDLKELKSRRKALAARIAALEVGEDDDEEDFAGSTQIRPEPTPAPEPSPRTSVFETRRPEPTTTEELPDTMLDFERDQAEAKAMRAELLREAINEIDRRIIEKVDEHSKLSSWDVLGRMRINRDIKALRKEHNRLDREMNEKKGFGAKFKEAAAKAYRSVKNKFKKDRPVGVGDLRGVAESTNASAEDIERVEAEARGEPVVEDKGSWKKWIKQRLGGQILGGIPEYVTAEKFRRGTKNVGQETSSLSRLIQKESNLSLEDAHDEYLKIKQEMDADGIESSLDDRVLDISAEITEQKIIENDATIDDIVVTEIDKLENKLKGYKKDFGQEVLTPENKSKIAQEMKTRLTALRSGEGVADSKEMAKMLRENLDQKWWRRYVYGAVETVLAGLLIKWVGSKLLAGKAKETAASKGVGAASKEITQIGLKDTIWAESKRQLVSHGVANPTNAQIQQVAVKFANDSGVKVVTKGGELLWQQTAGGVAKDIALGKGFMIKMAGGLKEIAAIKSGLVAGVL